MTVTNAHQPDVKTNRIACAAPGCGYSMHTYDPPHGNTDWPGWFRQQHTAQYQPGRAPDIDVDYAVEAYCSVCTDGIGDVQMCHDGDRVCCQDCGTHWDMEGRQGEREEQEDEEEAALAGQEPDPMPHDPTPTLECDGCGYTTTEVRQGMDHARATGHVLRGPGRLEGTTLTISVGPADDDDDDWDAADQ